MVAWVALYVGCIECGVPTDVLGVFETEGEARAACHVTDLNGDSWARFGGEGYTDVIGPCPLNMFVSIDAPSAPWREAVEATSGMGA